jgi:serine/threonine protein kinase
MHGLAIDDDDCSSRNSADGAPLADYTVEEIAHSCGWTYGHRQYDRPQPNLLVVVNNLGNGSLGVVDEVQVPAPAGTFQSLVRKRIRLPHLASLRSTRLLIVQEEARAVRSLNHRHITKIIGSYHEGLSTNNQFYSLLLYPVGDRDLKTFLDILGSEGLDQQTYEIEKPVRAYGKAWITHWFICLTSALAYMHAHGVRHQDIKPSNIIHRGSHIFFTDFSSSSRFEVGNTTSTENPARTSQRYAAPEVLRFTEGYTKHGRGTDVFALGAVFCEMLAVLRRHSVEQFHCYLLQHGGASTTYGAQSGIYYGRMMASMHEFFADDVFYRGSIAHTLAGDRHARPNAERLLADIKSCQPWERGEYCSCESG